VERSLGEFIPACHREPHRACFRAICARARQLEREDAFRVKIFESTDLQKVLPVPVIAYDPALTPFFRSMNWKRLLTYISGSVDQELLLRNEYLATENRILRNQIQGRLQLNDSDRISMAEIGKRLGRKALEEVAQMFRPETILAWHRRLVAKKFDGSQNRSFPGRPTTDDAIEELVLKFARENRSWGYCRIWVPSVTWVMR